MDTEHPNHSGSEEELPQDAVSPETVSAEDVSPEDVGHPKGTLAIVLIYAALFALGWALLYFVEFIPRGAPH